MLKALNRNTIPTPTLYPERVVQFGGGNFLRAFVDWMVDLLNEKTDFAGNVVIVKPTARGSYDEFVQQDGLFHVRLHGLVDGELVSEQRLVTCVSRTINPYVDFAAYLALARQPEIRFIVSNTTEAGIEFREDDKFDDAPPLSFPAKLTRFLYERFQHFSGAADKGCIILPCELIEQNGTRLKAIIKQYIDHWRLSRDFSIWLDASNVFCNTLVDRIVTGFPANNAEATLAEIGYDDRLLVEGERYHSWIIEAPTSISDELPLTKIGLNVKIVPDLDTYRAIKVRILNGGHTSMVAPGYMLGLEAVHHVMQHPILSQFIRDLLFDEVIPAMDVPVSETELQEFAEDVLLRFQNPFLHHRLLSIALNSIAKFKTRLLPSLLDYVERKGVLPPRITVAFAALLRFYQGEWQGTAIPLKDEANILEWMQAIWQSEVVLSEKVHALLSKSDVWSADLSTIPQLAERVTAIIEQIDKEGIEAVLKG
jgi:tagaturonate reductase